MASGFLAVSGKGWSEGSDSGAGGIQVSKLAFEEGAFWSGATCSVRTRSLQESFAESSSSLMCGSIMDPLRGWPLCWELGHGTIVGVRPS